MNSEKETLIGGDILTNEEEISYLERSIVRKLSKVPQNNNYESVTSYNVAITKVDSKQKEFLK